MHRRFVLVLWLLLCALAPLSSADAIEPHPLETKALTDPEGVLAELPRLKQLARDSDDQEELARLLLAEANACRVKANWLCQRLAAEAARDAAVAAKNAKLENRALILLSRAHINFQDYATASEILAIVDTRVADSDDVSTRAEVKLAYSSVSLQLRRFELAQRYAAEGIALLPPFIDNALRVRLMRNRARALVALKRLPEAREVTQVAQRLVEEIDDPKLKAEIYLERHRAAAADGDSALMHAMAKNILEISLSLKNTQLEGLGLEARGQAFAQEGKIELAIVDLKNAQKAFKALKLYRDELRVIRELIDAHITRNDSEQVTRMVSRLNAVSESALDMERREASDDFDEQLRYLGRETELARLSANEKAATADRISSKSQLRQSILAAVLAALAAAVLTALYIVSRRHARALDQLGRERLNALMHTSHDIRNPLSGILGLSELLMTRQLPSDVHGYVRSIHQAGLALQSLAQDLLDRGRIDKGKIKLKPVPTELRPLFEDIAALYRARAEQKGLALKLAIDTLAPHTVLLDPHRMHQVLGNLVGNALKFTDHGEIRITVTASLIKPEVAHLDILVADTGPGIAADDLKRMFRPFEKGEHGHRVSAGAGLGLSIAHDLVSMMGGRIDVLSEVGVGSSFGVLVDVPVIASVAQKPAFSVAEPRARLAAARVLIIDDDEVMRDILRYMFEAVGADARAVQTSDQARMAMTDGVFDLVIVDYELGGARGTRLIADLRAIVHCQARNTRFVIVSGMSSDEAIDATVADSWLMKPARIDDLRRLVA